MNLSKISKQRTYWNLLKNATSIANLSYRYLSKIIGFLSDMLGTPLLVVEQEKSKNIVTN